MDFISEISMDGFQIVSSDYFCNYTRVNAPTITIWDGAIGFSRRNIILLNACENVILRINSEAKKILVIPAASKEKDAIKWIKKTNPLEAKRFTCPKLTDLLYESWKWDKDMIYRAIGQLITIQNKVMLYYDFSDPESWKRPEAKNAN